MNVLAVFVPGLGCRTMSQDRPPAKVAPVGCQLATVALKMKTVTIPKGGLCTAEVGTQSGTSVPLAVNQLGRCRATRPCRSPACAIEPYKSSDSHKIRQDKIR